MTAPKFKKGDYVVLISNAHMAAEVGALAEVRGYHADEGYLEVHWICEKSKYQMHGYYNEDAFEAAPYVDSPLWKALS